MIKEEVKLRVANGWDMSVMRSVMIFLVSNDGPREKHCHEKSGSAASRLVCQLCLTSILNQWKKTQIQYRSTPLTVGFVTHQTNGGGVFNQYFPAVGFLSKMLKELIQFSETFSQPSTSWKSRTIELWRLAN